MKKKTHHSSTGAGKDLSNRPGGGDVEQVDTCQSSVDNDSEDENQYQHNLN